MAGAQTCNLSISSIQISTLYLKNVITADCRGSTQLWSLQSVQSTDLTVLQGPDSSYKFNWPGSDTAMLVTCYLMSIVEPVEWWHYKVSSEVNQILTDVFWLGSWQYLFWRRSISCESEMVESFVKFGRVIVIEHLEHRHQVKYK